MNSSGLLKRSFSGIILLYLALSLSAQERSKNSEFVPHVGQEGKDVIWVPTPEDLVNKMLEIAGVTSKDILIDLGSGDGRTVIAAAKIGATARGIEFNPDMVELSRKHAEKEGVSANAKFMNADLFETDLSDATVITMFLLPEINLKLRPKLLDLKPGTRIVSNTFTMAEWEPDIEATTDETSNSWYTALLWIVPAKVEGTWKLEQGELTLKQEFQKVYGTYKNGNKNSSIANGRLKGNVITFDIDGATYTGEVNGKGKMSGTVTKSTTKSDWIATLKGS
jgi:hypothetical protein